MASSSSPSFATLSFHRRDRLRFLQFPAQIYHDVRPLLLEAWAPGLQTEGFYGESYEYRFKDSPFGALGDEPGVASRRLVRDVLAFLYERSWLLVTPLSHSRRIGCKDTLIFRQKAESAPSKAAEPIVLPPVEWLVVALQGAGRLRIIYDGNGSGRRDVIVKNSGRLIGNNTKASDPESPAVEARQPVPHDLGVLVDSLKNAFDGIGSPQTGDWNQESFEFRLGSKPWRAHGEGTVKARLVLLRLIETLDGFGWRSYATIRQRTESDDVKKSDTWYFVRPEDWVAGSPFNAEAPVSLLD